MQRQAVGYGRRLTPGLNISQTVHDALNQMDKTMAKYKIALNDRQLACAPISSPEGQEYLQAMGAAANFAWVNRQSMTFLGPSRAF